MKKQDFLSNRRTMSKSRSIDKSTESKRTTNESNK